MPAEPVQRHHGRMGLTAIGVLELWTEGYKEQDRQPSYPVEGQIKQLARGWIDPVRIFENHQDWL